MSAVYFLGDLHLDHKAICKYRTKFKSVGQHNKLIKDLYHKRVTKRDKVFFIGDVSFIKETLEDLKSWVGQNIFIFVAVNTHISTNFSTFSENSSCILQNQLIL